MLRGPMTTAPLLAVMSLLDLSGCHGQGGAGEGARCSSDADCATDLVCHYGRCRPECQFDRDCPDGVCVAIPEDPDIRVCMLADEGCSDDDDCPYPLVCHGGHCRNPCDDMLPEDPCGLGRACRGGVCVDDNYLPQVAIDASQHHTCVLLAGGAVRCWGLGTGLNGQLGHGNTESIGDDETPASVGDVFVGAPVHEVSAGNEHSCAILDDGAARCWGGATSGLLGYGNSDSIGDDESPEEAGTSPCSKTDRLLHLQVGHSLPPVGRLAQPQGLAPLQVDLDGAVVRRPFQAQGEGLGRFLEFALTVQRQCLPKGLQGGAFLAAARPGFAVEDLVDRDGLAFAFGPHPVDLANLVRRRRRQSLAGALGNKEV